MNLFNCFQAVAFYTLTPFVIQWLFANGFDAWGWIASIGEVLGFVALSVQLHEGIK